MRTRRPARGASQAIQRHQRLAGRAFTLLEIMCAIAIFAGVLAAIYSSWTAILRSSRVGLAAAAEAQRTRMAVQTLEEAIVSAQMFSANSGYYAFLADTREEDAALSFVAHLPQAFPRSGNFGDLRVRRVTFTVEPDRNGARNLLLRQTPVLFEPNVDEQDNPLVLGRNVALFHLEFWGSNSREWEPEWLVTNQLPRLIRFSLAFARPNQSGVDPAEVISRVVTLPVVATPAGTGGAQMPPAMGPGQRPASPLPQNPVLNPEPPPRDRGLPPGR